MRQQRLEGEGSCPELRLTTAECQETMTLKMQASIFVVREFEPATATLACAFSLLQEAGLWRAPGGGG